MKIFNKRIFGLTLLLSASVSLFLSCKERADQSGLMDVTASREYLYTHAVLFHTESGKVMRSVCPSSNYTNSKGPFNDAIATIRARLKDSFFGIGAFDKQDISDLPILGRDTCVQYRLSMPQNEFWAQVEKYFDSGKIKFEAFDELLSRAVEWQKAGAAAEGPFGGEKPPFQNYEPLPNPRQEFYISFDSFQTAIDMRNDIEQQRYEKWQKSKEGLAYKADLNQWMETNKRIWAKKIEILKAAKEKYQLQKSVLPTLRKEMEGVEHVLYVLEDNKTMRASGVSDGDISTVAGKIPDDATAADKIVEEMSIASAFMIFDQVIGEYIEKQVAQGKYGDLEFLKLSRNNQKFVIEDPVQGLRFKLLPGIPFDSLRKPYDLEIMSFDEFKNLQANRMTLSAPVKDLNDGLGRNRAWGGCETRAGTGYRIASGAEVYNMVQNISAEDARRVIDSLKIQSIWATDKSFGVVSGDIRQEMRYITFETVDGADRFDNGAVFCVQRFKGAAAQWPTTRDPGAWVVNVNGHKQLATLPRGGEAVAVDFKTYDKQICNYESGGLQPSKMDVYWLLDRVTMPRGCIWTGNIWYDYEKEETSYESQKMVQAWSIDKKKFISYPYLSNQQCYAVCMLPK